MSLFDMILGQKLILLSLAVSVAPLLAAVMMILVSHLKQGMARHKRSRYAQLVQQQQQQQQQRAAVEVLGEDVIPAQANSQPVQPGAAPSVQSNAVSPGQPSAEEEQQPEEQLQAEPASAVQDILSSVFTDGDASEQYAALLQNIEDVDVSQLAAMCLLVGDQLRINRSAVAQD